LGGVAIAPIAGAIVGKLMKMANLETAGPDGKPNLPVVVGGGLVTAIGLWELGKALSMPNLGKFGAFYVFGRLLETLVVGELIKTMNLAGLADTVRIPDVDSIGTMRLPDAQSIGTVRIPDESDMVGIGTMRVPDTSEVGQDESAEEEVGQYDELEMGAEDSSDLF